MTDYQSYAALRIGLKKHPDPRERIRLINQYFDQLERDYLSCYPDEAPIFAHGLENEVARLINLKQEINCNYDTAVR